MATMHGSRRLRWEFQESTLGQQSDRSIAMIPVIKVFYLHQQEFLILMYLSIFSGTEIWIDSVFFFVLSQNQKGSQITTERIKAIQIHNFDHQSDDHWNSGRSGPTYEWDTRPGYDQQFAMVQMAHLFIDGLPINSMVNLSMAPWQCHNQTVTPRTG